MSAQQCLKCSRAVSALCEKCQQGVEVEAWAVVKAWQTWFVAMPDDSLIDVPFGIAIIELRAALIGPLEDKG